ncbi:hypothetical protein ACFFRR_007923 [Megaselia abdita]
MYMERLKKKRAAAARNQDIEIGEGNQNANTSQTTNRCRRNQQITTISGDLEVVTSSAPTNPRDKFTDLPPTYDEAVKVHLSAFPTEPAPAYTAAPEEPSIPTDSLEIQQRV